MILPDAYRYTRRYQGPIQTVIFDWAGTMVDFGSFAPTQVLIDAFRGFDVEVTLPEARQPMGLPKWDHIQALGKIPAVAARWHACHGRPMTSADVDAIYKTFLPLQVERVARYSDPIAGATQVIENLRKRGAKVGSCSGYPRVVMERLLEHARSRGLVVDCAIAADDCKAGGRPGPWMALANVLELGATDVRACVKVDDTVPGIEEGLAAGMWCVGIVLSGNEVGLSAAELASRSPAAVAELRARAGATLLHAGAHLVVDTIADLPAALDLIQERLARGNLE